MVRQAHHERVYILCSKRLQKKDICSNRLLKKSFCAGCSKMSECKAHEIMRNEAYFSYAAVTNAERNAADRLFSTAC